jgi:hypothetical protein
MEWANPAFNPGEETRRRDGAWTRLEQVNPEPTDGGAISGREDNLLANKLGIC